MIRKMFTGAEFFLTSLLPTIALDTGANPLCSLFTDDDGGKFGFQVGGMRIPGSDI